MLAVMHADNHTCRHTGRQSDKHAYMQVGIYRQAGKQSCRQSYMKADSHKGKHTFM